jgi:hypothetical protein
VGVQGPELRSKSAGACARTSNGRGIISRGAFVPFEPRPGRKPGRRGLLEVSLQVDKGDGREKEMATVAVLRPARQTGGAKRLIEFPF